MAPLWTNQAFFKVFATLRQLQTTNWLIIHFENFFRQLGIEPRPTPVTMDARRWNIDWLVEVQNVQNIRSSQWISLNRNSSIHSRIKWLIKVGRGSIPKCGTVTGGVIRAQFIDLTNAALIALIFRPTRDAVWMCPASGDNSLANLQQPVTPTPAGFDDFGSEYYSGFSAEALAIMRL